MREKRETPLTPDDIAKLCESVQKQGFAHTPAITAISKVVEKEMHNYLNSETDPDRDGLIDHLLKLGKVQELFQDADEEKKDTWQRGAKTYLEKAIPQDVLKNYLETKNDSNKKLASRIAFNTLTAVVAITFTIAIGVGVAYLGGVIAGIAGVAALGVAAAAISGKLGSIMNTIASVLSPESAVRKKLEETKRDSITLFDRFTGREGKSAKKQIARKASEVIRVLHATKERSKRTTKAHPGRTAGG
jgi:hypothetical protein